MMDVLFERDDLDVEVGGAPEMEVCLSPAGAVVPAGQTEDAEISGDVPEVLEIELTDAPVIRLDIGVTEIVITLGGEGGAGVWGSITGDLADQTDLAEALAGKADRDHDHDGRYYTESETDGLLAGKASVSHDHDGRYYTESEMNALLAGKSDVGHEHDWRYYKKSETDVLLAGKSDTGHDHDGRYYTNMEVNRFLDAIWRELAGKAVEGHNHDERYYTETEVNQFLDELWDELAGKAAADHDHDGRYYTESETDALLAGKSDAGHDHDGRYYTESETDALLAGKAAASHDHDGRYYTESEIDLALDGIDQALAGKADVSHTHDDRYYTESETDALLAGKAAASHDHDGRYYTESETDALLAGKADVSHTHDDRYYTESETDALLAGKSDTGHDHDGRYYTESETDALLTGKSDTGHDHDGRYYTESETDTLLAGKADAGHTHSNYVQKAGDTMSGNLIFQDDKYLRLVPADTTNLQFIQMLIRSSNRFCIWQRPSGVSASELFQLPAADTSITGNKYYDILTSKTPVTLDQGGTGGTDSGWVSISLNAANVASGTLQYRKVGVFVEIVGYDIKLANDLSVRSVSLANLPSAIRPENRTPLSGSILRSDGTVNNYDPINVEIFNKYALNLTRPSWITKIETTHTIYLHGMYFVG